MHPFHIHTMNGDLLTHTIFGYIEGCKLGKLGLDFNSMNLDLRIAVCQHHGNDTATGTQIKDGISGARSGMGGD